MFYVFTFQILSCFTVSPLETFSPISPAPASMKMSPLLPTHSYLTVLAYTEASSLHRNKGLYSHWCQKSPSSVLYIWLEPWIPPCVLLGWWFSPWELWGVWPVDTVADSMGLQTHSGPSVPSQTLLLGTPTLSPLGEPFRGSHICLLWASKSRHPQ